MPSKLTWRDLADRRVALMLALAFSTGLPFLLVFSTLSVRLREAGIPLHTLGMFSWLGLAYSLKFLWAPFVDWQCRARTRRRLQTAPC